MPRSAEASPPARGVNAYAIQRPSGEKLALSGSADVTAPNGSDFRPLDVNTHSEYFELLLTENRRCDPSRDQNSGMCSSPGAGVVKGSGGPPAIDCQKIARVPSRSDWNVTRRA